MIHAPNQHHVGGNPMPPLTPSSNSSLEKKKYIYIEEKKNSKYENIEVVPPPPQTPRDTGKQKKDKPRKVVRVGWVLHGTVLALTKPHDSTVGVRGKRDKCARYQVCGK